MFNHWLFLFNAFDINTKIPPTKRQIDFLRIKLKKGTVELNRPKRIISCNNLQLCSFPLP